VAHSEFLATALEASRAATEIVQRYYQRNVAVRIKADKSPVTAADVEAEQAIRSIIAARYPTHGFYGEETGSTALDAEHLWIVDPIDGTKAFTHGVPLYSTLLAVEDDYGPAIGVIVLPALDEVVYAGRGRGCFRNGRPAHVSRHDQLAGSYLTTSGFDYWPESTLAELRASGMHMRTWGDGYGYALVATGRVEAMVDPSAARWDLAAMPVIIGEAGGRFSDYTGAERADGGNGVATNGLLHDEVLALLRR